MRLIDADALKKSIKNMPNDYYGDLCIGDAIKEIDNAPTIDAVPVVRGEWNPIFNGADTCKCSVCKRKGVSDSDYGFIATPYCPNCGAKMESEGST